MTLIESCIAVVFLALMLAGTFALITRHGAIKYLKQKTNEDAAVAKKPGMPIAIRVLDENETAALKNRVGQRSDDFAAWCALYCLLAGEDALKSPMAVLADNNLWSVLKKEENK